MPHRPRTVFEPFRASADSHPDNGCFCAPPVAGRAYDPDGVEISYGEMATRVERLVGTYRDAGYGTVTRGPSCWRTGRPSSSTGSH